MAKKAAPQVDDEEDEDLDEEVDEAEDEGDEDEDEAPAPKSKSKGKKAAKPAKGKAAKSAKKSKSNGDDDEGFVTLQDLASEAEIEPQSARVKLRDSDLEKPEGGRWRWKEGSKALKDARKALGL